jgi:hypothetical protein
VTLKRFKLPDTQTLNRYEAMNAIRADTNRRLNQMRPGYTDEHPDVAHARRLLTDALRADAGREAHERALSPETCAYFGLRLGRTGRLPSTVKWAQVMSLYVCVFDDTQRVRLNPQRCFIGMDFIWRLLLLSPYRGSSGTAHSNLLYHGLRNFDKTPYGSHLTPDQWQQRRSTRIAWRRALREMLRLLRDVGQADDDGAPRRPAMTPQQRLQEAVQALCGEQLAGEVFARAALTG